MIAHAGVTRDWKMSNEPIEIEDLKVGTKTFSRMSTRLHCCLEMYTFVHTDTVYVKINARKINAKRPVEK